jgi:hypothetical protein
MSRIHSGAGDTVYVKPAHNIYTVLSAVATVVVLLGLMVVYMKAETLFGGLLKAPPQSHARSVR